jgi:hypothetical protein
MLVDYTNQRRAGEHQNRINSSESRVFVQFDDNIAMVFGMFPLQHLVLVPNGKKTAG